MTITVNAPAPPTVSVIVPPSTVVSIGIQGTAWPPSTAGRTLYVAQSWPAGADPARYFTDPAAALVQAATMSPLPTDAIVVEVHPGFYPQNLTLVSNVHLFGMSLRGTEFSGAVTWLAGQGVNVGSASLTERIYCSRVRFTGAVTIDATGKPSGVGICTFDCRDADLRGNLSFTGRNEGADFFQTWDGVHGGSAWALTGIVPTIAHGVTLSAAVVFTDCGSGGSLSGVVAFGAVSLVRSPGFDAFGSNFLAGINVDAASSFRACGSALNGVVTVAAGGSADLRSSQYMSVANLAGAGSIERTVWRTTAGPSSIGANVVTLAPPYADANYSVQLTKVSGSGGEILVTGKQPGQFTISDSAGGNTFDICILKE